MRECCDVAGVSIRLLTGYLCGDVRFRYDFPIGAADTLPSKVERPRERRTSRVTRRGLSLLFGGVYALSWRWFGLHRLIWL